MLTRLLVSRTALSIIALFFVAVAGYAVEPGISTFPGAEGFGSFTPGGRGGKVYLVTSLLDYGPGEQPIPGSIREAVEAEGKRIVVFRVSGLIELKAPLIVLNPYITIAGQSAPGEGICLKNYLLLVMGTHDVVIRYMRGRPGGHSREEQDAISVSASEDVVIDHCSANWSTDEALSVNGNNITVQWCVIAEGLNLSFHPKGAHGYGALIRSNTSGISYHHNIFAHNTSRNPRPGSRHGSPGIVFDFRNNVIYDWGYNCGYNNDERTRMNYVGNYLKPGPSTKKSVSRIAFKPGAVQTQIFLKNNFFEGFPDGNKDNWKIIKMPEEWASKVKEAAPFPSPPTRTDPPREAYRLVLAEAGASLPARDAVDRRIIREIQNGTGRIVDSPDQVGGWPEYPSAKAPPDSDRDGMPDSWEEQHNLNAQVPMDNAADPDGDGYTNIEEFLNGTDPRRAEKATSDYAAYKAVQERIIAMNLALEETLRIERTEIEQSKQKKPCSDLNMHLHPQPSPSARKVTLYIGDGNNLSLDLVRIPAGTFLMGSPESEEGRKSDETQHKVIISRPFYMGAAAVTYAQFDTVLAQESNKPGNLPAAGADWFEAVWFCKCLSKATGRTFRLPTEAEWEYACRAGTSTPFSTGGTISPDRANYNATQTYGSEKPETILDRMTPTGVFPPNPWGLYDMHGNLFEWCSDWYGPYPNRELTDPTGPESGDRRVIRGGAYTSHPNYLRSASRYHYSPIVTFGFRVVMEVEE